MSVEVFWLNFRARTVQTGPFSSCSGTIPYERPYNDVLKCLEDGFACVFSLLSIILKFSITQEAYKSLFIDSFPTMIVYVGR